MAEFVEVMKVAGRMCTEYDVHYCAGCPMHNTALNECALKVSPDCHPDKELIMLEAKVMKWASENPESCYPTWREWQQEHFPDAAGWMRPCNFISLKGADCINCTSCERCAEQPIPADIAEKLGIKPIPAEPRETLVDEYERLRDRVENLNLYLNKLREAEPWVFECVKSKMSDMPGYVEVKTE